MTLKELNPINLTAKSIDALDDFSGAVDFSKFNRNLRNLLLQHFINEKEDSNPGFCDLAEDMQYFFNFLDTLEDEKKVLRNGETY
ncbi:MAG: hypothetical protein AAFQ94_02525 [Bacteroidota bacterium]